MKFVDDVSDQVEFFDAHVRILPDGDVEAVKAQLRFLGARQIHQLDDQLISAQVTRRMTDRLAHARAEAKPQQKLRPSVTSQVRRRP